ncbi:epididymal-specific lipocalin-8 [Monodon monoceros]|uniref:epididymal-specific lipocalin-8 n=1 Tax=Monodon monoceros TaxID=40151 RepID=UPI0010F475C5|nr:epididymal-specific lipocalin-8 [Monodon monoceros]
MEAGLLSAVLGIILVQVEMTTQDLDLQKIAGFWREVGVASSQNLALQTPKRLEALFLTLRGEELTVKAAYNRGGACETEQIVSSEINVSGKVVFPGHREIQVIDTDYKQYAILRVSLHWRDKEFHVLKYFIRSLEGEYEPGFWKFRGLTADTGLYLVARHGRCAKLLKEASLSQSPGLSPWASRVVTPGCQEGTLEAGGEGRAGWGGEEAGPRPPFPCSMVLPGAVG